jgi:zeaxanthin glucosyltransferase
VGHFGIISPPVSGHLNPFFALGHTLVGRGHRVTLFQQGDVEEKVRAAGLEFFPLGNSSHPKGSLPEALARITQLKGLDALRFTVSAIQSTTEMFLSEGPEAVQKAGIDLLLVDQTEPAGALIAQHLGIPFVTVCNALVINREPAVPPVFIGWDYNPALWARLRNTLGYRVWDWMMKPILSVMERYRRSWNLPVSKHADAYFSVLAQVSQLPASFDFPRTQRAPNFHYLGPFREKNGKAIGFPWDKLDGRPLIYTSLGTLQNRTPLLLRTIAQACAQFPVQLVISHGGDLALEGSSLPGHPLVVSYAPQQELLARGKAKLVISHAGLNTVMDSMSQGVPMVAVPLTYEQPAIAARLRWSGAGEVIPLAKFSVENLTKTIQRVLESPAYYQAAAKIAQDIQTAGGVERAADIIEAVLKTEHLVARAS